MIMRRLFVSSVFAGLLFGISSCAETNPSTRSAREFAAGRTFLDGIKITEPSEVQKKAAQDRRQKLADQARKLGDNARAQRILAWTDTSLHWTEAQLARRNENDFGYAEQDPSPTRAADAKTVSDFVTNSTRTSWSEGYGMQVSYAAPDGTSYLWFPGNNIILKGQWKIERASQLTGGFVFVHMADNLVKHDVDAAQICYMYGANTVDAVSRSPGGRWQCQGWNYFKSVAREHKKGDIFGLAARSTAPFILSKEEDKIINLQRKMKSGS
jgi:hypothetical protein